MLPVHSNSVPVSVSSYWYFPVILSMWTRGSLSKVSGVGALAGMVKDDGKVGVVVFLPSVIGDVEVWDNNTTQ